MSYEIFNRKQGRVHEPCSPQVFVGPNGRMTLNGAMVPAILATPANYVVLLWDAGTRRVAIKPLRGVPSNAYKVNLGESDAFIEAADFLDYIGLNRDLLHLFPAEWNSDAGMFEIALPG